jgi:hypothetical protein
VSPFDPNATAERYLKRRGGDGGYMLIVQSDDLDRDRARLAEHWAGPKWREHVRRDVVSGIRNVELQSDAPRELAKRWSEVLGRPVREQNAKRLVIELEGGEIRFVEDRDGRGEGLAAFDVDVVDREKLLTGAKRRGCAVDGDEVSVAGIRIRLA